MGDVLKSAQADGALWLLVIAFCVAAPMWEEIFSRGVFSIAAGRNQGSASPGAIFLSSLAWTSLHLQYDWFFFGEVFSIGLLLGYLRYRTNSTWLTIVLHGINNTAATIQTFLAGRTFLISNRRRGCSYQRAGFHARQPEDCHATPFALRAASAPDLVLPGGSTIAVLDRLCDAEPCPYESRSSRVVVQHGDPLISPSKLQELTQGWAEAMAAGAGPRVSARAGRAVGQRSGLR